MVLPRSSLSILLTAAVAVAAASQPAAQIAVPAQVLDRIEPTFPGAAKQAGVEGDVRFRAAIDATGRAQNIEIVSVPQEGLGFEEAVMTAVSRWRFAPARLRDVPVPSDYAGTLRFVLKLPGQAMLSASSQDAWNAVRTMLRQLRIPVDKADDRTQLLTSGHFRYLAANLPNPTRLGLPLGFRPERLTLHVYVTPGMQPARVAVGSVVDLEAIASGDTRRLTMYGHEEIAQWFLAELARRMAVRAEGTAVSAEGRAEQSMRLMPPGLTDPCATKPAQLVATGAAAAASSPGVVAVKPPQVLQRFQPRYPQDLLEARKTGLIAFRAEITEHGTLVNPTMTEPADAPPSFVNAAQLAFGLWRFSPTERDGCPVRVSASFQSEFRLK